jgi:pseudouridine synthase
MTGVVETSAGPRSLVEDVELGGRWERFDFQGVVLEARATLPPLLLLDKPEGVVTSRKREAGAPTVFDTLHDAGLGHLVARVEPVGRLDRDTSGLLLLTADGRLIQRLTHPKRAVERTYHAEVEGVPDPDTVARLRAGDFALRDGHTPHPTRLEPEGAGWTITLTEGKYHEVRRIFAAAGAPVVTLRRTGFAGFGVDDLGGARVTRLEEDALTRLYEALGVSLPPLELEVRHVSAEG